MQQPIDPNLLQRRASDPGKTVWVGASAGSGKTSVLTARMLRLMLPQGGKAGTDPARILCLTFTKTAAGEMQIRVMNRLEEWAVCADDELHRQLTHLLGHAPDSKQLRMARALFARVLDVPGGLRINTIHGFCMSVLKRFPLESHLAPGFQLIEGARERALIEQCRLNTLRVWDSCADAFLTHFSAEDIDAVLQKIIGGREMWNAVRGNLDKLLSAFGLTERQEAADVIRGLRIKLPDDVLKNLAARLATVERQDTRLMADRLHTALVASTDKRWFEYVRPALLTATEGTARKAHLRNAKVKEFQDEYMAVAGLVESTAQLNDRTRLFVAYDALLRFADDVLARYEAQKDALGYVDNTGLVLKTAALLRDSGAAWVQYKLDGGIDHVLVDEAQDTAPAQWAVIDRLTAPFFDNIDDDRTLFVVGDEKQSIFSFQNAAPELFRAMQEKTAAAAGDQRFDAVPMHTSFRSVQVILDTVDAVFAKDWQTQHTAFRADQGGRVEIWPLETSEKAPPRLAPTVEDMSEYFKAASHSNPEVQLAKKIATTIKGWLDGGYTLSARRDPVNAGDILIVVRKRGSLVGKLVRHLKQAGIAVEGLDRLQIRDALAVQDVLAAMAFAVQPQDDLSLAGLLRSPLVGVSEDELYDLCHGRAGSVYEQVRTQRPDIAVWLDALIASGRSGSPHGFVANILDAPCPASKQSGLAALLARLGADAEDPLLALLERAIAFERDGDCGLSNFILLIEESDEDIKRQQDEARGAVRIMTVHGAKGLQAPIVIMPDTLQDAEKIDVQRLEILWPRDTKVDVPLPVIPTAMRGAVMESAYANVAAIRAAEHDRLLYVAMTRAEDMLIVCGAQTGTKPPADNCWYSAVKNAVLKLGGVETPDDGVVLTRTGHAFAKEKQKDTHGALAVPEKADWLYAPAPEPLFPPRPLTPSKPVAPPPAPSPLVSQTGDRFRRGLLLHTLFQYLPSLPSTEWPQAIQRYLAHEGKDLSDTVRQEIADTAETTLAHPDMQALLGSNSRAEVALTGMVTLPDGTQALVSGQVDRLVVTADAVLVLDYKTNRPAPPEIPAAYQRQIALYIGLLRQIYPDRAVRGYIVWTDGVRLVAVP